MPPCNNKHYTCSGSMASCNKNEICIKKRQQHVVESVNKNVILRQRSLQCLFIMYKQLLRAPHINLIRYYVCNAVPFGWTSKIGGSFIAKTRWNFYNSFSLATIFKTQEKKTQDLFLQYFATYYIMQMYKAMIIISVIVMLITNNWI